MLKKQSLIILATALVFTVAPALAQDDDKFDIDIGFKTVVFFYNATEGVRIQGVDGWSLAGEVIFWFPQGFGLGAELEYYTVSEDIDVFPGVTADVSFSQMPFNINAYYRFKDVDWVGTPFIGAGICFIRHEASASADIGGIPLNVSIDDTTTGFTVFGGIEFGRFLLEMQWMQVDVDLGIEQYVGETGHEDASGLSLWLGIRF